MSTPQQGEQFMLKPMNCPHHCEIYNATPHSYKDLPLRMAEFGTVYRYEQSGELHGLTRVRSFTQDDAHHFCRQDQLVDEFKSIIDLILYIFKILNFNDFTAQISLRDPNNKEKYIGSDENWEKAERDIIKAAGEKNLVTTVVTGEAAFYGPKLDFMVRDSIGRKWQLGTIQVDYNLPDRFDLTYNGSDNQKHRPVMIHRTIFGSLESFVAVLIENSAGKFPLWLAPEKAVILTISEKFNDYAGKVLDFLNNSDICTLIDERSEKIGKKIRDNELKRIPYLLIVGEKEVENNTIAVRKQGEGDKGSMKIEAEVMSIQDALRLADNLELDLVEISSNADPPVCKIVDYQKFLYQQKKKQKEIKAKAAKIVVKEIRFGPNTDDHDYNFKLKHAVRFLEEGAKVRAYVFFKGRSILFKEQGEVLLLRFANDLEDYGKVEQLPRLEGKRMIISFSPKKKK